MDEVDRASLADTHHPGELRAAIRSLPRGAENRALVDHGCAVPDRYVAAWSTNRSCATAPS